jgi:transposase InsO family protein
MPWKERTPMDEKKLFIKRLLSGDPMSEVCKEYGISRTTGHKFYNRYLEENIEGLLDLRLGSKNQPHRTPELIEKLILKLRKNSPRMGPKKLKKKLEKDHQGIDIPAASTIGDILKRNGIEVLQRRRRKRGKATPTPHLTESTAANEVWCIDFKGKFKLGNGKYCSPLTVTDHYSRYLLCCESMEQTDGLKVKKVLERVFKQYGLPKIIRSDNGPPFASTGLLGHSQLSIWLTMLGIKCERIQPGHPEQNGRHERMHLTLKEECTRPAKANILTQQECFDYFIKYFNHDRSHEGIGEKFPQDLYRHSETKFPMRIEEFDYGLDDETKKVNSGGFIRYKNNTHFYVSHAFVGQKVGIRELKPKIWQIRFMNMVLGFYHSRRNIFYRSMVELEADKEGKMEKKDNCLYGQTQSPFYYENSNNF